MIPSMMQSILMFIYAPDKNSNLFGFIQGIKRPGTVSPHSTVRNFFFFFLIWHFLIKSSDFEDWAHQGGFLC